MGSSTKESTCSRTSAAPEERVHTTYSKTKLDWKVKEGIFLELGSNEIVYKYELLVVTHIQKLAKEPFSLGRVEPFKICG